MHFLLSNQVKKGITVVAKKDEPMWQIQSEYVPVESVENRNQHQIQIFCHVDYTHIAFWSACFTTVPHFEKGFFSRAI